MLEAEIGTLGSGLIIGQTVVNLGTAGRILYNNGGLLGEYAISGSGSVAMTTSPTFVTPNLGTVASGNVTACTGAVVQVVSTITGTSATGTTVLPNDNTIPQNSEGDQYMSLAITPTNTNNKLDVGVVFNGAISTNNSLQVALFQDSTANALAAVTTSPGGGGFAENMGFHYVMTAGTTSSTTFKVRAGSSAAGTTTFNGSGGTQIFGGVMASSIVIVEYRA